MEKPIFDAAGHAAGLASEWASACAGLLQRCYVVLGRSSTSWMRLPSGRSSAVIVA